MRNPSILLVDDDEVYIYVTKKILANMSDDISVKSFNDGEQAIEFIQTCTQENNPLPGVILLDINMPYLDGWGFLSEFKKLVPKLAEREVNIYMVTSSNDPHDMERAKEFEQVTGYVVKPVFEDKLAEILTDVYDENW